ITLVNGGAQQRCFAYIDDGIEALLKMIENKDDIACQRIFNIGNPSENISIRALAEMLITLIKQYPEYAESANKTKLIEVDAEQYYGSGYQDVALRVPSIQRAKKYLAWQPQINLAIGLQKTLDFYLCP
ncbi:MAG: NAD-dependent epimerase/dehydratase family protein, partial [Gammaproteobacteria bacterium]|nr:NAD-dependent epimerase/dehydratase family protein [Gammaproteobacteria bacterium]